MTITTHVVIKNPDVPPPVVLDWINQELLRAVDPAPLADHEDAAVVTIGNAMGQGPPTVCRIQYRTPPAPITAALDGWRYDGTPDPSWCPDDGPRPDRELLTGSMVAMFATGGTGAGDLLACYLVLAVLRLGPIAWRDEARREWHPLHLARDGFDRSEWAALTAALGRPARGWKVVAARPPVTECDHVHRQCLGCRAPGDEPSIPVPRPGGFHTRLRECDASPLL